MKVKGIDEMAKQLEKKATDELSLLAEVGPDYFSTADLIRLKGQWQVKHQFFNQTNTGLLYLVAASPIWAVLSMIAFLFKMPAAGNLLLSLFPLSFLVFFVGLFMMKRVFKGNGHLAFVGEAIEQELTDRKNSGKRIEF